MKYMIIVSVVLNTTHIHKIENIIWKDIEN